ncbi:MAG: hypothetical protein K2X04_02545 [Burkholderiales bacterium]|nr:hypothetical protein [Burkholderiales bacterium]
MASLYKYFTEKDHMDLFMAGNVRFSSLAYYKHLENNGTISDENEGEAVFSPKKETIAKLILTPHDITRKPIALNPIILASDPELKILLRDYSHYFTFCSSHKNVANDFTNENNNYKYFVEFDKDDFNNKFEELIKEYRNIYEKNNQDQKLNFSKISINNIDYLLFCRWESLPYGKVTYYDYRQSFIKDNHPAMRKTNDFKSQQEYRHLIYVNYFKDDTTKSHEEQLMNHKKYNNVDTDIEDSGFFNTLNIVIELKDLKIINSGKIRS